MFRLLGPLVLTMGLGLATDRPGAIGSTAPLSQETGSTDAAGPPNPPPGRVVASQRIPGAARHSHLHPERALDAYVADPPPSKPVGGGPDKGPEVTTSAGKGTLASPFEGMDFNDNEAANGAMLTPADPSGAAGPAHLVSVVNSTLEIRDKATGVLLQDGLSQDLRWALDVFFADLMPEGRPFDARVRYDLDGDRFVVVAADRSEAALGATANTSRLLVAVSQTSDPTQGWYFAEVDAVVTISGQDHWLDFPGLAVDKEALFVVGNVFQFQDQATPGLLGGTRVVIIEKGDLYAGMSISVPSPYDPAAAPGCFSNVTHQPAQPIGTVPGNLGTYLVGFDGITAGSNQFMQLIRVEDAITTPNFVCDLVQLGAIDGDVNAALPDAPQNPEGHASPVDIETNARRVLSAAYVADRLVTATTVNPPGGNPDSGQATVYWAEFDTSDAMAPALSASGFVGGEDIASGTHTFYPSVSFNRDGGLVIGFSASGVLINPGAYFTLRSAGDTGSGNRGSVVLRDGVDYYQRYLGGSRNRWGDYSATSADTDAIGDCFWVFNQYAKTAGNATSGDADDDGIWGTAFNRYCNEGPTGVDDAAQVAAAGTVSTLIPSGNDLLANDIDPDLDILGNNIDGLLLTTTVVTPPVHGAVTLNGAGNGRFEYVNDGTPNLDMGGDPIIKPDGTPDMDDSFVYEVCDDGSPALCDQASVALTVLSGNHIPGPVDDAFSLDEGTSATPTETGVNLIANDLKGTPTDDPTDILTVNTIPVQSPVFAGAFSLGSDGSYSYTHDGTENFSDSFVYEVCDNGLPVLCAEATVNITINPVNETPLPQADSIGAVITLAEDGIATQLDSGANELDANDSDPDGDALFIEVTPVSPPGFGQLTLNSNGTFVYDHDGSENFSDAFVYRACDRASAGDPDRLCADATVTISVQPVNDAPMAGNGTLSIDEGAQNLSALDDSTTQLRDLVSDDDSDIANVAITTVVGATTANGGSYSITGPTGTFSYSHDGSEVTSDSFTYQACDDGVPVECSTGTISIVINPVDDVPVANVDAISVPEGGVAVLLTTNANSVLANDIDADSTLTAELLVGPQFNSIGSPFQFNPDGTFQYSHDGTENFSDSFTYRACEVGGMARCTSSTLVTITINPVNEAPDPAVDGFTVAEGGTFDSALQGLNLLANDSDPDGDSLTVEIVPSVPPVVAASFNLDPDGNMTGEGNFIYQHDGSETVADMFTYRVCDRPAMDPDRLCSDAIVNIAINPVNDPPVAADDSIGALTEDDPATPIAAATLLANDVAGGGENQTLSIVAVANPVGGSVVLNSGDPVFTPAADFNGMASFQYTMQDDATAGSPVNLEDTATVSFTITEVNDVPVPSDDTLADAIEDVTYVIDPADLLANDLNKGAANENGQTLTVDAVANASCGAATCSVSINGGTGMIEFVPGAGYNGAASFTYTVIDDGTTAGASDPRVSVQTALVSFNIAPANDPPIAGDDSGADVEEDTARVDFPLAALLANDSPTPGETETIAITAVSSPVGGSVVLDTGAGRIEFTPDVDFNGPASFVYTLSDDAGGGAGGVMTDTATVSFTITEINDPPLAEDDSPAAIAEDMTATFSFASLLANDSPGPVTATDEAGQTLSIISVDNPVNGSVVINGMNVEFTPDLNYFGPASFEYTLQDDGTTNGVADPLSDIALVTLLVDGFPDPPVASDDTLTAVADSAATVLDGGAASVLANDTDPDSPLVVSQVTGSSTVAAGTPVTTAAGATVTVQPDGTFSYLFGGVAPVMDSFDYEVCDDTMPAPQCDTATVNVNVLDAGNIAACAPGGRRVVVGVPVAIETASEFTGSGLSYSVQFTPATANLGIGLGNGIITGIPDATDLANSPLRTTVTASDGINPDQFITFDIVVEDNPDGFDTIFYADFEDSCVGF